MKSHGQTTYIIGYRREKATEAMSVEYILYKTVTKDRQYFSIGISSSEESELVHDITGSAENAARIFGMVADGTVTPCCVFEVIEDLLESIP